MSQKTQKTIATPAKAISLALALGLAVEAASAEAKTTQDRALSPSEVARFQVPLGAGPIKGPSTAKVTILEFVDYECQFCARAEKTVAKLLAAYPAQDLRYQVLQYPMPCHPNAELAARGALAAAQQGKFWEMHTMLFANQNHLARQDIEGYARVLGLDGNRFKLDLDGPIVANQMEIEKANVESVNNTGVPAFVINGRVIGGARPLAQLKAVVDEELAYADRLLATGIKPTDLYNEIIKRATPALPEPTKLDEAKGEVAEKIRQAIKRCGIDSNLLKELRGATVGTEGTTRYPEGHQPIDEKIIAAITIMDEKGKVLATTNKQHEALSCLARELQESGVTLTLP